ALFVSAHALYLRRWQRLAGVALGVLAGLALSAFYLLPALLELPYTKAESTPLAGGLNVDYWLLKPASLLQSSWSASYSSAERFRFARWYSLLGAGALAALLLGVYDEARRLTAWLFVAGWLAVLFLQLDIAHTVWFGMPMMRYV